MKTIEELRARLAEIDAKLVEIHGLENLTQEDVDLVEELTAEADTVTGQISAKEKLEARIAANATSTRKTAPTKVDNSVKVGEERINLDPKGGFKNAGEFFMAVRSASNGDVDKRFRNTMFEKHGEDGGFLVPSEFISTINKKIGSDESLLSRTRQFTVGGNSLSLPTDETQPWNGGIQAYWTQEAGQLKESKSEFGTASWRLHKLACLVPVTDELLEDTTAIESYIQTMAPEAIMHKLNGAIISGDGNGKLQGILNSDFKITVAKEVGQTADTIVARNVINMYSRMIPASRANAVWYINAACEPQLRTMKDDQGNFIYLAPGSQMNQSPYGLLLGRPVIPMLGSMPQLGDEGDIVFADLSYFYTILKSGGMKSAVSQHLYFDRDKTAYKFTMRIDGSCPFKSPVQVEFGNYEMSAFVTLEDRA